MHCTDAMGSVPPYLLGEEGGCETLTYGDVLFDLLDVFRSIYSTFGLCSRCEAIDLSSAANLFPRVVCGALCGV
jgi:hypothetical protein